MPYPDRVTVCVSSQAGCAMACGFCATGQAGFERHLTTGEIVEQVVVAARWAATASAACPTSCSWAWASRSPTTTARGPRSSASTTTSACRPATSRCRPSASSRASAASPREALPVNLAVSLHAADDELRDELVPINRRYPLDVAGRRLPPLRRRHPPAALVRVGAHRRRQRHRRAGPPPRRVSPGRCGAHVNLIPLNPTPGLRDPRVARPTAVRAFRERLARRSA